MKKIFLVALVVFGFFSAKAQQSFEGGYLMPGFAKEIPIPEVNLTGRFIGCTDYAPFKRIDATILSKNEALNLAALLIRAPKELRLRRDIGNIIRSTGGYVSIFFSGSKETWVLNFHPGQDVTAAGEKSLRFFYLD